MTAKKFEPGFVMEPHCGQTDTAKEMIGVFIGRN